MTTLSCDFRPGQSPESMQSRPQTNDERASPIALPFAGWLLIPGPVFASRISFYYRKSR